MPTAKRKPTRRPLPKPPAAFEAFARRYPRLAEAWSLTGEEGLQGPLHETTVRLIKLAIAIGAMREGAVHSSVRKARAAGFPQAAIDQVVALAAGTLGFPATVAVYTWTRDEPASKRRQASRR